MIVTPFAQANRYFQFPAWTEALAFLGQLDTSAPDQPDLVPLGGSGMKSRVMSYPTRGPKDGVLEAHDQYVDLQMTLEGAEGIDCFNRDLLTITQPYDATRDVILFERPAAAPVRVENRVGVLSVYFPEDAHMAQQLLTPAPEVVKKVVVKIPLALFP